MEITGLSVDDEPSVLGSIESGLREYFLTREPFTLGVTVSPRKDQVVRTSVGAIIDAVVSSAGGIYLSVGMTVGATPYDVYALTQGEKAKLGVLTNTP